jgi:phospholipid/cholesterol/gamma-HCH transport system substrate-binding protein
MKFRIRFADQIVGVLIIVALLSLIFVIFMLGKSQRWFAKDYIYLASFDTATGLGANMPVQYKGFTIGNIKSFSLVKGDRPQDDKVVAEFTIYDSYIEWVKEGSLVELNVSPIGLGNQFQFHPGLGEENIPEGEEIYTVTSPQGKDYIERKMVLIPNQSDSISVIISRVNTTLEEVNKLLATINAATAGSAEGHADTSTELGRILGDVGSLLATVDGAVKGSSSGGPDTSTELGRILGDVGETLEGVKALPGSIDSLLADLDPILGNINTLVGRLSEEGLVSVALDEDALGSFDASLQSLSGILKNLEDTSAFLPAEVPQIVRLISGLEGTLKSVDELLISLKNNPLLRKGIPDQVNTESTGLNPRDISF